MVAAQPYPGRVWRRPVWAGLELQPYGQETGIVSMTKVELLILFLDSWLRLILNISHEVYNFLQLCPINYFMSAGIQRSFRYLGKCLCISEFYVPCFDSFQVEFQRLSLLCKRKYCLLSVFNLPHIIS